MSEPRIEVIEITKDFDCRSLAQDIDYSTNDIQVMLVEAEERGMSLFACIFPGGYISRTRAEFKFVRKDRLEMKVKDWIKTEDAWE